MQGEVTGLGGYEGEVRYKRYECNAFTGVIGVEEVGLRGLYWIEGVTGVTGVEDVVLL